MFKNMKKIFNKVTFNEVFTKFEKLDENLRKVFNLTKFQKLFKF